MEASLQREVAASAAEVWKIVGDGFGDLSWSSGITASHLEGDLGVGGERVCEFPPNMFSKAGGIRERLLEFDPVTRTLAYRANSESGVMREAVNRWTVTPLDENRCIVAMHATVELRGIARWVAPLMRPMLKRMGMQTLKELETHVIDQRGERTTGRAA